MVAHYWSGHAHGWELAVWWVCIAAPLTAAACARWWPSRRRSLARTAAETERVLRAIANAALSDDIEDQTTEVDVR
jgi:predicted MFS family arabinose efflux permease